MTEKQMPSKKPNFKLEDVDKLTRGKRSGKRIGSRAVGHHLSTFEREEYTRAGKQGFLSLPSQSRSNLWNVWEKACLARGWPFLVLIKHMNSNQDSQGEVYENDNIVFHGELKSAKDDIKARVSQFL